MKMIRCSFFRSVLAAGLLSFAGAVFAGEAVDFEKEFEVANKAYTSGKWNDAAEMLSKLRPLAKTDWQKYKVNYRLTYCYSNTKQSEKAIEIGLDALKYPKLSARDRNRFNNIITEANMRLKRYDEALKLADAQLAEPAREDDMYYTTILNKGIILYETKKFAEAVTVLKKADSFNTKDLNFKNKLQWFIGASAMKSGDKATAIAYFEKVAKTGKGWFASSAKKHLKNLQGN